MVFTNNIPVQFQGEKKYAPENCPTSLSLSPFKEISLRPWFHLVYYLLIWTEQQISFQISWNLGSYSVKDSSSAPQGSGRPSPHYKVARTIHIVTSGKPQCAAAEINQHVINWLDGGMPQTDWERTSRGEELILWELGIRDNRRDSLSSDANRMRSPLTLYQYLCAKQHLQFSGVISQFCSVEKSGWSKRLRKTKE